MAAEQRRPPGEHPDPEILLAYHERALPENEADRVQEHLVHCPDCAQAVLDFAAFPDLEPPAEEFRLSPAEMRQRWQLLEERLAERRALSWRRHQVLLPLAAAFLVAAVGLGLWASVLRNRVAELEGPRGDVFSVTLRPGGGTLRSGGEPVPIPGWAERVDLILAFTGADEAGALHEADLVSSRGGHVASRVLVRRQPEGYFILSLPRGLLSPGEYTAELYARMPDGRRLVASYPVTVEGEPP